MLYSRFFIAIILFFGSIFQSTQPVLAQPEVFIRVNIAEKLYKAQFQANENSTIWGLNHLGWQNMGSLPARQTLHIQLANGNLKLTPAIQTNHLVQGLKIQPEKSEALVGLNDRWYRGQFEIKIPTTKSYFYVINRLPIEQYLYSVIPSEMPASWPLEALKSQAVAARTYAISHLGTYQKEGYDVKATTSSQVYQGVKSETNSSHQAVHQTLGQIMTYQNKPIHAYFHASSGGKTEDGSALWAPFPYLKSVRDFDHQSPKYTWFQEYSQQDIQKALASLKLPAQPILRLEIAEFTTSGRIKLLRVYYGPQNAQIIKAANFRLALGLNSTFFNLGNINQQGELIPKLDPQVFPKSFQFAGRGWGHGLGLSQWGARQMALNGYRYSDILKHYYQQIQIKTLDGSNYKLVVNP